jgi:hypothetical protein
MPEITPSRYMVQAGWGDVPHIDAKTQRELLDSTPPFLRDARSKGIPSLGAGAIYPIPFEEISCKPFKIPEYWPKAYALDVGWNRTAALWGALDRSVDVIYLYTEHYRGQAEPSIHASAIKARGDWIPGVIDPAARGRAQTDGEQLLETSKALGLKLTIAINAVESGIYDVWERMSTGRLKVFDTLQNWQSEYRLYRRDEKGKIVKKHDHLMDDTRYLVKAMPTVAIVQPIKRTPGTVVSIGDRTAGY